MGVRVRLLLVFSFLGLCLLLLCSPTYGVSDKLNLIDYKPKKSRYQRPEDLLEKVPILNMIPRSIRFDRYLVKLNTNRVEIQYSRGRRITGRYSFDFVYQNNTTSATVPLGYAETLNPDKVVFSMPQSYVLSVAPFQHVAQRMFFQVSMRI